MENKCYIPRCKGVPVISYLGRDLCGKHRDLLLSDDAETEAGMLDALGLERIEGDVVEASKDCRKNS